MSNQGMRLQLIFSNAAIRHWKLILLLGAILLTGGIGIVIFRLEQTFYGNHAYFLDSAYYQFYNARLFTRLQTESQWTLAIDEWLKNNRHPLRTIPLILLAPQLLAQPLGYLATALPMLSIFLFVFGWAIHRRTQNILYTLACLVLFCAMPGFYSVYFGFGVYWLDFHALLLAAAAAFALLNSERGEKLGWIVAFAFLAAAAGLSRWTAAGYVFVMCAPIFAGILAMRWKRTKSFLKAALLPLGVTAGIIAILAGYFLVAHSLDNMEFYSKWGYALNKQVVDSLQWHIRILYNYVGLGLWLVLATLCLVNLIVFAEPIQKWDWFEQASIIYIGLSHLAFQILVLRITGDWIIPLYAFPAIFMLAVAPAPWRERLPLARAALAATVVVLALALFLGRRTISEQMRAARVVTPKGRAEKQLNQELARELSKFDEPIVWKAFFDVYDTQPTMETFYASGKLPLFATNANLKTLGTPRENTWKLSYPGMSPQQVAQTVYAKTEQWMDIAVVFDDLSYAEKIYDNDYGRTVARYVSAQVRDNPQWERVFTIESKRFGTLGGYRNRSPQAGAYEWLQTHRMLNLP